MSYPKTYRVQGIPATSTKENCGLFISSILRSVSRRDSELLEPPLVHSLGPNPYSPERNPFQVATITFEQVPKALQNDTNEVTVPITTYNPSTNETFVSSVTVDSHFSGFTPLNYIEDGPDHQVDCIAITGLGSHPFGSWKQRGGQHMWLRDCLPYDLKGARILLYGYNTDLRESQAFQNIEDIAIAFSRGIRSIRQQRAIIQMKGGDEIDKENFNSIYGILFFGVPNQGIPIEHWLSMVERQPNESLVRNLGPDSTYLRDLHDGFRATFPFSDSVIVYIYETEQTRAAKEEEPGRWARTGSFQTLVPKSLATDIPTTSQPCRALPIKRNHSDMVKFSSRWDEYYQMIVSQLTEISAAAVGEIRAKFLGATQGSDFDIVPTEGWTQLHHAAFRGDENGFRELLRVPANLEVKDDNGQTPLHIAAIYGRDAAVKSLLDRGADKDARNYDEQTPLYSAASRGHGSIVVALVAVGADMEARDTQGKTPLYAAARNGHGAVARLLADRGANRGARAKGDWTPVHAAAWYGHETAVRLLIEGGADKSASAAGGMTPLHGAVQNGHEAVTTLLLRAGARIESKTDTRETPLHIAANCGGDSIARLLVDKGADMEARDSDGRTPLYVAARGGHERVTRLLLQKGADWRVRKKGGWTSMHAAAWFCHESALKVLVDHGADMELRNEAGETPLFIAARRGHEKIVRLLIERGANTKARTRDRWTPLRVAESNGHKAVANLLRRSH
ncbi:hypothetical protein GP486_006452 [Trichoglossum hirsutum]|uniref:Uncharacterized protein n=1 Tax=Trichoglossum hirsutum TaxID=265104 RepID=A0A9P8L7G1_9PEZI|nr:hypothetical protein GP486_006452 [Trichoglossum hirsutum]